PSRPSAPCSRKSSPKGQLPGSPISAATSSGQELTDNAETNSSAASNEAPCSRASETSAAAPTDKPLIHLARSSPTCQRAPSLTNDGLIIQPHSRVFRDEVPCATLPSAAVRMHVCKLR